ncbi:MAG: acyl-CoA dehydrogenase [Tepidiformaceae bacterium]
MTGLETLDAEYIDNAGLVADFNIPAAADAEAYALALAEVRKSGAGTALRPLAESGALVLASPGSGHTWARFRRLAEIAAVDLSLGRLAEGHTDALAILAEAELPPVPGVLYGIWAASGDIVLAEPERLLSGERQYCSGAGIIDRALVPARSSAGKAVLVDVDLAQRGVQADPASWPSTGMAASQSSNVRFVHAEGDRTVGPPDFYLSRHGFWRGSLNVAACWYGGALGLARSAVEHATPFASPFQRFEAGSLRVAIATMRAVLKSAADETDCTAGDSARPRAIIARHVVYEGCRQVLEIAGRLGGTGAVTHDAEQSRRLADLPVYLRQHHPGPDLAALAVAESKRHT